MSAHPGAIAFAQLPDADRAAVAAGWAHRPDTDAAQAFDALTDEQRWEVLVTLNGRGSAYTQEVERIAGGVDPATVAAWERHAALAELQDEPPEGWPVLDHAARYGLANELLDMIGPHTEADPAGVLLQFLTMFGVAAGLRPYVYADGARHCACLNVVLVGETAKARKGTGLRHVRAVLRRADPSFVDNGIAGGFGSGESLVDSIAESEDSRRLVLEPEWARVLNVAGREGATLSHVIRQAWDGDRLEARSRGKKSVADGAHVGVVGHITRDELRARLADVEVANGFANRHLFVLVRRGELLPAGSAPDPAALDALGRTVADRLLCARKLDQIERTTEAGARWDVLYRAMAEDEPGGLLAAVIARDQAQVLRLSLAYALTDGSAAIKSEHLAAAWAVWRYCRAGAALIWGDAVGDPVADTFLEALRAAGTDGLDGRDRYNLFSGHQSAARLAAVTNRLLAQGRIAVSTEQTGGRPREVYRIAEKAYLADKAPPVT